MSVSKIEKAKVHHLKRWIFSLSVIGGLGLSAFFVRQQHEKTSWPQIPPKTVLVNILKDDGTLPLIFDSTQAITDADVSAQPSDMRWEKVYGGVGYQAPFKLISADDGGAFIAGHITNSPDEYHVMYVMRVDEFGDQIWARTYKTDQDSRIHAMRALSNGDLLLVGETTAHDSQRGDTYMVRINIQGNIIWERAVENGYNDWADTIAPLPNGGAWIMGGTTEGNGFQTIRVLQINADGEILIERLIDKYRRQVANFAMVLEDESLFFAGHAMDDNRLSDIYYGGLSSEGELVWDEVFTWPIEEWGVSRIYGAFPVDDKEFYLFGVIDSGGETEQDVIISRVNEEGDIIWRHRYGRAEREAREIAYAGMLTPSRGILVAGEVSFYHSERKMYLLCVDAKGKKLWHREFGRTPQGRITSLAMMRDGYPMLAGYEGHEDARNWYISRLDKKCP